MSNVVTPQKTLPILNYFNIKADTNIICLDSYFVAQRKPDAVVAIDIESAILYHNDTSFFQTVHDLIKEIFTEK